MTDELKQWELDNEISSKKCTAYEDGCEEWAGCPCVYYEEIVTCSKMETVEKGAEE